MSSGNITEDILQLIGNPKVMEKELTGIYNTLIRHKPLTIEQVLLYILETRGKK